MAGRPPEGKQTSLLLSKEHRAFAESISEVGELADGVRQALDEAMAARGLPIPKRPNRRIVRIVSRKPRRK